MKPNAKTAGFTLIELLVVISIIALLSSVILAALAGARQKGQAGSIQEELLQVRNWFELNRDSAGSYKAAFNALTGTAVVRFAGAASYLFTSASDCTSYISDGQLQNICKSIVASNSGAAYPLIIGGPSSSALGTSNPTDLTWTNHTSYSSMGLVPSTQTYVCIGSSGNTSSGNSSSNYAGGGCLSNP